MKQYFNNKFICFLFSLDIMGPSIALNFDGRENYRTGLGTFFTFGTLIICLFTISGSLESVFYKTNPNVYSSSAYDDEPLLLNNTSLKFYITVLSLDTETFTYTPINKNETNLIPTYNLLKNNRSGSYYTSNQAPLVDCGDSVFKDYNTGFVSEKAYLSQDTIEEIKRDAYCLPDIDYTIGTNSKEQIMFNIGFNYGLYIKALQKYDNIIIQFTYRTILVNPDNFTNYYNQVWKDANILIKPNKINVYQFNIEKYKLNKDQTKFIFSDEINTDLINGKDLTLLGSLDTVKSDDYNILSISFIKNNISTKTNVKYKSFNDVISDFGGSYGVLFPFFQFILKLIVFKIYNLLVVDHVIKLYEPQDEGYRRYFKEYIINKNFVSENRLSESDKLKIEANQIQDLKIGKLAETEQNPELKINRFIDSFDKQSGVFIYKQAETKEEFIRNSVKAISLNKKISIDISLITHLLRCLKTDKKTKAVNKLVDICSDLLEDTLNISSIFSSKILFKKMTKVIFSKEELEILTNFNFGIHSYKLKENIGENDSGRQIKYLIDLNYDDRKNKKLLKEFINAKF
jgi:hypothetical protein